MWAARGTLNPYAFGMALACLWLILTLRRVAPRFPGLLAAVALAAAAATYLLHLPIETLSSRFGPLPRSLHAPSLPAIPLKDWLGLVPAALGIAVLGGIESLLSAVVADGMTGRRHRSNCELAAQGWANIASALFGGLCVTGAIARTATNVRAGAHGPVAGLLHAAILLIFMLVAAPLAGQIPLAALGAVLAIVAWNMIEREQIAAILKYDRGDALVFLVTAGLTIFQDIIVGIAAGVTPGSLIFMHRMAQMVAVETSETLMDEDHADSAEEGAASDPDFLVYRIAGPFFFGAVNSVAAALDQIGERPKIFVLDLAKVPLADAAAAHALHGFIDREQKHGVRVILSGASRGVRRTLVAHGVNSRLVHFSADEADARAYAASRPGENGAPRPVE